MDILFKNCRMLLPDGDGFRAEDGYLGVRGKSIDYVGKAKPEAAYAAEKDMTGKILMPGLVNAHTHAAMTLLRGKGTGLPLQNWLFDCIFPIEERMTPQDMRVGSELAMLEMLACGTVSFTDMYMFPRETAEAVLAAGMKANLCRPVQSFDETEDPRQNRMIAESLALYDEFHGAGEGRVLVDFSIHAEYTCTAPAVRYYAQQCQARGGNLHIHLAETEKETQACIARYGMTPAAWFDSLGAFDGDVFAAHCVTLSERDTALLREKNVKIVHNPSSNMKLGSGFAPVRRYLDAGITVGLGTDGASSNNDLDMFEEMHLASLIHNGRAQDALLIRPRDVLAMATAAGAAIQRRPDTGRLAVGMRADIAAVDTDAPHLTPDLDTEALLVYAAKGADVCMTMVDGEILYENGTYKTLDRERIMAEAKAAARRLHG